MYFKGIKMIQLLYDIGDGPQAVRFPGIVIGKTVLSSMYRMCAERCDSVQMILRSVPCKEFVPWKRRKTSRMRKLWAGKLLQLHRKRVNRCKTPSCTFDCVHEMETGRHIDEWLIEIALGVLDKHFDTSLG